MDLNYNYLDSVKLLIYLELQPNTTEIMLFVPTKILDPENFEIFRW